MPKDVQYAAHVEEVLEVEVIETSDIARELGQKSAQQPTTLELDVAEEVSVDETVFVVELVDDDKVLVIVFKEEVVFEVVVTLTAALSI